MARIYIDVFHRYSFVNEINLSTYISPSDGNVASSLDHNWHNINSKGGRYVASPALSDHYAVCEIFKGRQDSPQKSIEFRN